ncbi:MAG: endonuclease [Bacteroidota bacterium]|nr:endonuclease [Bacteroidota bacterium]
MKKLFIAFVFISGVVLAQIPPGYYNAAQGLTGTNLKVALHNIIKNHTVVSYNGLWSAFQQTDKKTNNKVWDMYSHNPTGTQPYEYTFVTDQCGSYNSEGDCYNREHSWPQSWFNSTSGPDSDMFHIYPTDGEVNGKRSNFPYGNVSNPSWTSMNGGKLGPCTNAGYSQTVFEPINEYKGDLARGYFYMSTRYYSEDAAWGTTDATNKSIILPWQMNVLLAWHHLDPVSAKETSRNNLIYSSYQNNRNPYIDHPQYADSIWASGVSGSEDQFLFAQQFSIYPNPSSDQINVISYSNSPENSVFKVTNISGKIIEEKIILAGDAKPFDCSQWQNGIYFISISNSKALSNFKFIKQ